MRYTLLFVYCCILLWWSWWVAQFSNPSDITASQIVDAWYSIWSNWSTELVTRYDLAELLSVWNCEQCIFASPEDLLTYDTAWRDWFAGQAGNNFDDIQAWEEYYNGKEYSVCIAKAAEKWRINGFPRTTSPFCPGRFCGANVLSYGELAQALYNIIAQEIYDTYTINRQAVEQRSETRLEDIDIYQQQLIWVWVDSCGSDDCVLNSVDELNVYLKYCRRNLEACNMLPSDLLWAGDYPIWFTNILVSQGIVTRPDVMQLGRYDEVSRSLFDLTLGSLVSQKSCVRNIDYDLDGVRNDVDNCPVTYNPNQKNRDADDLWDVCDDDIDDDNLTNPIGVIDDQDNIDHKRYKELPEVDLPDDLQPDTNKDKILTATATPASGSTMSEIVFQAETVWDLAWLQWYLGDGSRANSAQIWHMYSLPGSYTASVIATRADDTKSVVKLPVDIISSTDLDVAFVGAADPLVGTWPLTVDLTHTYEWEIDSVRRYILDETLESQPDETLQYTLQKAGVYELLAEAYNQQTLVWVSRVSVTVIDLDAEDGTWRWAILSSDPLVAPVGSIISFDTTIEWFVESDISQVTRDFGDTSQDVTESLAISRRFDAPWPYIIWQTIEFDDGYPSLYQEATIYITSPEQDNSRSSELVVEPLVAPIWSTFLAWLEIDFDLIQIAKITWSRWDSRKKTYSLEDGDLFAQSSHTFKKTWLHTVQADILTTDGTYMVHQATVQVTGQQVCIDNIWVCDLDKDGIIDQCDTDIDGDSVPNLLWLLIWENEDCRITWEIVDSDRLLEQVWLIRKWAELDNCSFESNSDQSDEDEDAFGDVCDSTNTPLDPDQWWGWVPWDGSIWWAPEWDRDNDGLPDSRDACPDIPENGNGVQDDDGCPELPGWGNVPSRSTIQVNGCVQCPCPKVDYEAQVLPGDRVKAVLTDPSGEIVYSHTAPRVVK